MFLPWKASMSGKTAPLQSQCACPVTLECSTQEHQEHCLRKNKQLNLAIRRHWYKQGIQTILSYSQTILQGKTFKSEPLLLDFHIKRTLILSADWSLLKFIETLSRASKGSFMDVHFLAFLALLFFSPSFFARLVTSGSDLAFMVLLCRVFSASGFNLTSTWAACYHKTTQPSNPPTLQPSGPPPRKSTPKTCM